MPADALALTLAAAALHAGWNVLIARAGDPEGAGAAAVLFAVAVFAPVAALTWRVEWSAVPYIAASATAELAYFALLAAAYRRSEMSLVYPIARGLAPVLVLLGAAVATAAPTLAARGRRRRRGGGGRAARPRRRQRGDVRSTAMAVGIAATIACYTVIDKSGLHHAATIPYFELVLGEPGHRLRDARSRSPAARRDPRAASRAGRPPPAWRCSAPTGSCSRRCGWRRPRRSRRCARRAS